MVRPLRVEYEGAYYHVMNRGRGRRAIFHGDAYRDRFLQCLSQAHTRFALETHAYCLMDNHYHLLVRTPRGNLSRAMRHVNGVYTQHYNRLRKTDGPLFRGRYKAINIEADSYLLEVSRYIHRNPVETRRPLVGKLEDYAWSSYAAYRRLVDCPDWLQTSDVLDALASGKPTSAYARFVARGNDEETESFYKKGHWPAVRGSAAFAERVLCHPNTESPGVARNREPVAISVILDAVATAFEVKRQSLLIPQRGRYAGATGRAIAMKLCQDLSGAKLRDIAKLFNVTSDSTVSQAIRRLDERVDRDKRTRMMLNRICEDLTP